MTTPYQEKPSLLLVLSEEDKPYVSRLSGPLGGIRTKVYTGEVVTAYELIELARRAGLNCIATTREDLLKKLLPPDRTKGARIDNYAGSLFQKNGMEILILDPLKQLISKSYGDFLARRYLSKLTSPAKWRRTSKFNWKLIDNSRDAAEAYQWLSDCDLIAVDSETFAPNIIRCVGYTGIKLATGETMSYVIPMKSMELYGWIKRINWLEVPKVLQNGKYDCAYFAAYDIPLWGYFYDTVNALHSWYSELPKDLASVTALLVRDSMYWKDLARTNDLIEYYKYCALDTWGTIESFISWILEAPDWAKKNYVHEFTQVPICHMMEMTGIKRDMETLVEVATEYNQKQQQELDWLQKAIHPAFNPSSPKQVLNLLHALGYRSAEDSAELTVTEASYVHPLNEIILNAILEYRGLRKLTSTYLSMGVGTKGAKKGQDLSKEFRGRILYSINPHGTDTARKASKEHHFWCGLQLQNIPDRDEESRAVKRTLVADEGFELYEADFDQAEARGVAYKSGDIALLEAVNSTRDFHSINASAFFGVPYAEIYQDAVAEYIDHATGKFVPGQKGKVLNKKLRDLSKRTNHGSNYNMGAKVLLETMGSKKVREAQKLLKLPANWDLLQVTAHLLKVYERTYPRVKTTYYNKIKKDIKTTRLLVGDTGWTRYCFGDPDKSKPALNSYVAHVTQSLNAVLLDRAVLAIFLNLAFSPFFKLLMQIHDSVLFQVHKDHQYLAEKVKELMTFSVPIRDCLGITRQMTVPVSLKRLGQTWEGTA